VKVTWSSQGLVQEQGKEAVGQVVCLQREMVREAGELRRVGMEESELSSVGRGKVMVTVRGWVLVHRVKVRKILKVMVMVTVKRQEMLSWVGWAGPQLGQVRVLPACHLQGQKEKAVLAQVKSLEMG
jgi:hypothetical protein